MKKKNYNRTEQPTNNTVNEPVAAYMYNPAARTMGLMGMTGKKEYESISNDNDFIKLIRAGIPKHAMDNLMDISELSLLEMAAITHISDRTLRRYKPQQKLPQEQSERMLELARLYTRGEQVLGTMAAFREWMDTALAQLGGKKPKEFLDTSIGINMLLDELGRIEHGVFA